jgi:hypothetical protein
LVAVTRKLCGPSANTAAGTKGEPHGRAGPPSIWQATEAAPAAAPAPELKPEQQVATLEPPAATIPEKPAGPELPADLASAVQQRLKDIGCYTNAVDGDWGAGSRAALQRFFDAKKEPAIDSDPTGPVYLRLKEESGRVCEVQVATPKPQTQTQKPSSSPKPASTPKAPSTPKAQPQPAAPQPSKPPENRFNGGGIGVFR